MPNWTLISIVASHDQASYNFKLGYSKWLYSFCIDNVQWHYSTSMQILLKKEPLQENTHKGTTKHTQKILR